MEQTQLSVVAPQDYGLEESQTTSLTSGLQAVIAERSILKEQYIEIIKEEITPELSKKARELRLKIKDNRTKGIIPWHKVNKEVPLRLGQFIDAVKNKEVLENEQMESRLEEIEKFVENQEKERIAKIDQERKDLLRQFEVEGLDLMSLGEKSDGEFNALFQGYKFAHTQRIEAELAAEKERQRLAEIKLLEEDRMRQIRPIWGLLTEEETSIAFGELSVEDWGVVLNTLNERAAEKEKEENERLEAASKREAFIKSRMAELMPYTGFLVVENCIDLSDEDFKKTIANAQVLKEREDERLAAEKKEKEERLAKEKKEADEAKARAEKAEIEAKKLRDEAEAREREENQRKAAELAAIEEESKKGDSEKIEDLKKDIESIATKYEFKSEKYKHLFELVKQDLRETYKRL